MQPHRRPPLNRWVSCCPFACLHLSASASASSCAPPFVVCCVASFGPSLLLRPSIVVFSFSFLPLEFPLIVVITVFGHPPLNRWVSSCPFACLHLSASASASSCAPPFVGCCVTSLGPSLLLCPSIVVFSSSFLPLEFPHIVVITFVSYPPLDCWLSCCPFACLRLSASAPASSCAPPFVGCCVASLGPSLLLRPSIVVFSSSFLPLEFPLIAIITVVVHRPSPIRRRHLSPPSPVQQYLIVVSSSSFVHHIVFIVIVMLHVVIVASSSCPPLLLAGSHRPLPDAGWFLFVQYSHRHRSVVGKHHPQLDVVAIRHSLSSLLTAHAQRRPHAFGWTLEEGARGQKYPMHCLIVVIVVVYHPSSPSSVSVVNCPLSTIALSPHLPLLLLNIVATSSSNG